LLAGMQRVIKLDACAAGVRFAKGKKGLDNLPIHHFIITRHKYS
jgi:hypothetical protein